ncbi:hypothetical protein B0H10DRAFT_1977706 [Mycena sp. CBHHK59/15]|nr:hypothetical protein B0H10DRAFT_1977706 [Mycena sp. CBHHK59/15]
MAENLARYTNGNAHIVIVGRNHVAAEEILASFPKPPTDTSGWRHEFISCDASLMKNVEATTTELLSRLPKINLLVLSAGYITLLGRDETEEGIDKQLALRYYARWKFIHDLLPALKNAQSAGQATKVMSILGGGGAGSVDFNDLGLKKNYSGMKAALASMTYNDLALDEFALRNPEITFTHIYPGFVDTPTFTSSHWAVRLMSPLIRLVLWLFSATPEVAADYMLYGLLSGEKGFFRRGEKGNDIGMKKYSGSDADRKRMWDHTQETTNKKATWIFLAI